MGFIILFPKTSHLVFLNVYWCINIIRTPLSLAFLNFFYTQKKMKFSVSHNYVYQDDTKNMKIINHNNHYR